MKRNRNNIRGGSLTIDKDREYFIKKRSGNKNIDIRYWRSIKEIKEKISNPFACNQERCPLIKQRLDLHTSQHHPESLTDALLISPKPKTVRNSKRNSNSRKSTQTSNFQDQSEGTKNEPLVNRYVLQDPTLYKLELDTIVMKWIQFVPIYAYTSDETVIDNAINSLVTNINNLANNVKNIDYEESVKIEINKFLNMPGMWYPNDNEDDKTLMKNSLGNYLWKSITEINDKHFVKNRSDNNVTINNNNNNDGNQVNYVYSDHKNWDVIFSMNECKDDVENKIREWLNELKQTHKVNNARINKKETMKCFLTRLTDLLDQQSNSKNYKTVLKREIVDILNELQICSCYPKNTDMDIDIFAEDLTNKIVNIQTKYNRFNIGENSSSTGINKRNNSQILNIANELRENNNFKHTLLDVISECFENKNNNICSDIVEDATSIIVKNLNCFKIKKYNVVKADIANLLSSSYDVSLDEASNIAQQIVDIANEIVSQDDTVVSTPSFVRPCFSGVISVYTTADDSKPTISPVTSTPKAKNSKIKKDIQKLNPEERSYGEKLKNLIQAWMSTLPKQFHTPKDKLFKETIIDELVGNILEEAKLAQIIPHASPEQRKYITYFIFQWLHKFKICTDFDASTGQTNQLVEKILTIPVPILTRPQYGTRQEMKNLKYRGNSTESIKFVPDASDILEDEISIWMNEQPSDIYVTNNKSTRGKLVQELAAKIRSPLANKRPQKEITKEVAQWLTKIVKPGQKNYVNQLSEKLKDRIIKLPQDQTLAAKKDQYRHKYNEDLKEKLHGPVPPVEPSTSVSLPSVGDTEKTLMEFIGRYIEHNYEIDDLLTRGAFTQLLKIEIIRLNPPTRKEVYDNCIKTGLQDYFSTERLDKELQYIKIVTDWLKFVPLLPNSIVGNKFRLELINTFAKDIYEIEDRRVKVPDEMDHDAYLKSIILVTLSELPVDEKKFSYQLIDELMSKIVATRPTNQVQPCCKSSTINTKKIYRKEEIGNFIEEYFQENSRLLDGDEVKMKACSARLLEEIKQIVQETADPELLSKEKVYEKFNEVPVTGNESVMRFNLALDYAKEITEWMKNLPLLPISNQPEARERNMNLISALAEKIVGRHCKKAANPMDTQADSELVNFVNNWISELPVDPLKEIVYPIVISQLMNRIKKIDMKLQGEKTNLEKIQEKINKNINEPKNISQKKPDSSNPKTKNLPPGETGEGLLVDAIEQWCDGLPINGKDDIKTKTIKDNVAKNLYQKIGDLNANPRIHHDDLLFQEMVADEIDTQLEHVPQNTVLQNNREKLKTALLEAVTEAKQIMKKTSAGDNYRHKLERTIESAIPYPVKILNQDPAFEIYKNRLAEIFILENFDHGNDAVKINYEKRIKNEIDKYFQSAQNRNVIPLSKDQIYNELYSSLFKVPIPNENSIVEEVEEVKTKCEIEKWFQQLPLRPAEGVREVLDWDKILSTLAKRIHEIEKRESEPDEKIHKEITKWLLQLPLLPEQRGNVDQLANNLQALLKSTAKSRKFVPIGEPEIQPKTNMINMDKVNKSRAGGVSHMEYPSRAGRKWVSSSNVFEPSSCQVPPTPRQMTSAEIIHMFVKRWCDELPIRGNTIEEQVDACNLLDDLKSRIILKIIELNSSLAVLKNDILYNELFDDALEVFLSTLPPSIELQETKERRKFILIQGIQQVKPLIIEEKARQEYKKDLNETVSAILGGPHNTTADMAAMFDKIKEEIVENFLEYNYNIDDEEGKQAYKMLLHDAVVKYFTEVIEKWDNSSDILMKRNELVCELSKIPKPSIAVLKQEVEEIRMKNEVRDFFNQLSLPEESKENMILRDHAKNNLAKMLNDIEKGGHNSSNDNKMKEEISTCLQKLNILVDPNVINAFVTKLKNDETERKAPPPRKESERVPSPCQAVQATGSLCGQASGVLQASSMPAELNPCQLLQANVPLSAFTDPPSNSRYADGNYPCSGTGVAISSSIDRLYEAAQQIPVLADGSVHRSILPTSVLQPAQVPANEMVMPLIPQLIPCQQPAAFPQPIPEVIPQDTPRVHLLSTVQASTVNQRTGQAMAQASEPDKWPRATRPENTRSRETRPKARRQDRIRSTPSSSSEEECICESRKISRNSRNRPPCYYPRDYCKHCQDMQQPWWEKGGRKYLNDNNMQEKIARCLKLLNIQANPEVINGYLNKLQSDQIETQDMLPRTAGVMASAVLTSPDEAIQAIVNKDVPSYGQTCGQNPSQVTQARMSRTDPQCYQASAMPVVQNPNHAIKENLPLGSNATLPSNSRCADGNNQDCGAGVGQLYGAADQIPVVADGSVRRSILNTSVLQPNEMVLPQISQNVPCQPILQRSIQVPNNIQEIPSKFPEAIPQVIPCGQGLSSVQTSSTGNPTAGIYERQAVAENPRAQPRETRQGRPRSKSSAKHGDDDRHDGRRLRRRRNLPPYYYSRYYCDDCEDMMPPWWGMVPPGYFY